MFKWIAKLFTPSVKVAQDEAKVIEKTITKNGVGYAPKTPKSKKSASKACDFDKLTKTQLLAEAKHRGVKANASMSKADILSKVKSAK
tara:strand:+ start:195 stop:458 length:264 start_codon:yes stop_codon:yes gene_type:complete